MRILCLFLTAITILTACNRTKEQQDHTSTSVESPVIAPGLSNKKVKVIAEDSLGHIWMGTIRGLNKYNVHEFHQYYCTDNPTDIPDNQINDIMNDSQGNLWIATVNGACRYTDRDNFHNIHQSFPNRNIHKILQTKDGRILFDYMHHLGVYDETGDSIRIVVSEFDPQHTYNQHTFIDPDNKMWTINPLYLRRININTFQVEDSVPLPTRPMTAYMQDNGDIWMAGGHNLTRYSTSSRKFTAVPEAAANHPKLQGSAITVIHPYSDHSLLLATERNGLFLFDFWANTMLHQSDSGFPFEAPDFNVSCIFTDSHDNLWFGSVDQGYAVRYHYKARFNTDNFLNSMFEGKSVISLDKDSRGNLWIVTLADGMFVYNTESRKARKIEVPPVTSFYNPHAVADISRIMVDSNNDIWLAYSKGNVILHCTYDGNGLNVVRSYKLFMPLTMVEDKSGTVWVGTQSYQVYAKRKEDVEFKPVNIFPASPAFVPSILAMPDGKVLFAGFYSDIRQIDSGRLKPHPLLHPDSLAQCIKRSVLIPTDMMSDRSGNVWIGTVSNGLLKYNSDSGTLRNIAGTPCLDISSIEEDSNGNLWVATQYGLGKYDPHSGKFTNYYEEDGIGGNQFYDRASCSLPDGSLAFGGTHGLTVFKPAEVGTLRSVPLLFEDLKIHNRVIHPTDDTNISKAMSHRPDITIDHDENGFSISFAALDYSEHDRVHYQYRMEGFDKYWIDAGNNREAYYANLPSGIYKFKVRISNNDNSIEPVETSINIKVKPAPWRSWWAICLYVVAALIVAWIFIRILTQIRRERRAAHKARLEKEQERRVNNMNMSFFANVSHEFRTPLTMISGPITQLYENPEIKGDEKRILRIVHRNVARMLRLVNQLMDFNKLENDTLKLQVCRTDMISHLHQFIDIYSINAQEKGIKLTCSGLNDSFITWIDIDKCEKIVGNILSNALKFTPAGGQVEIRFDVITPDEAGRLLEGKASALPSRYAMLTVTDSGNGIPDGQLEKIFERYYQVDRNNNGSYNWGTGIGLYYARALARLHHGYLWAENRTDGHSGAVFTVIIPIADECYPDNEHIIAEETQQKAYPIELNPVNEEPPVDSDNNRKTLLVVDDDTDVAYYLKTLLSPYYNVICRFDADSAFKTTTDQNPDLIISDVVMPGRDGYDLCRQIKNDSQVCHIPVILVTAKSSVENQIEGLNTGADAYVTKPFDPHYLLALVKSLLGNREKLQLQVKSSTKTEEIEQNVLSPQDQTFLSELYAIMESELSNSEIDINQLTERMRISRTKFYYKIKGLTGENPAAFFKAYKLNRAAELIAEGKYNISEIADMTGFSTLSHFSTSFKKQFGVSPSEYRAKDTGAIT